MHYTQWPGILNMITIRYLKGKRKYVMDKEGVYLAMSIEQVKEVHELMRVILEKAGKIPPLIENP